ncbi:hypothetical protein [Rhizobium subbaraonis]|nr:hypothetical protein [Rhizobium subbaraonis]
MLPRIATSITVPIPSPTEPGGEAAPDAARPVLSAEALANLRAAVLLRLLEAMMRQIERGGDGAGGDNAGNSGNSGVSRRLLDALFAAIKTLPQRGGAGEDATRNLANLIARLPAELRPSTEKLLTTVLASTPTRILMEVIRNPGGPDAQRLAQALLSAAAQTGGDEDGPVVRSPQRFFLAEAHLAAAGRRAGEAVQPAREGIVDSRALQAALRRLFEGEKETNTGTPARPSLPALHEEASTPSRKPVPEETTRTQQPASRPATEAQAPVREHERVPGRPAGEVNRPLAGTASPVQNTVGREVAEGPAQTTNVGKPVSAQAGAAVPANAGREHEGMMRLIAGVVANLSEDEALVLRLLLQAPLPEEPDMPALQIVAPQEGDDQPEGLPRAASTVLAPAAEATVARAPEQAPTDAVKERAVAAPVSLTLPADDDTPTGQPRASAQGEAASARPPAVALPDQQTERPPLPAMMREGLAIPFVPYLPAADDLETREARRKDEAEEDKPTAEDDEAPEDRAQDEEAGEGDAEGDGQQPSGQADSADTERRRRRVEELVGPPDPGFAYYQKLGEYWT